MFFPFLPWKVFFVTSFYSAPGVERGSGGLERRQRAETERGKRSDGAEGRSKRPERRAEAERGQQSEGEEGLSEGPPLRASASLRQHRVSCRNPYAKAVFLGSLWQRSGPHSGPQLPSRANVN